jgi:glycosyltransferase involved in cell wall biosynthesis
MKTAWLCTPILPEIERDAGSRRILHTAQVLSELGFRVSLLAKSRGSGEGAGMLERNSVEFFTGPLEAQLEMVREPHPDLVVICYWHLAEIWMPHIRRAFPRTRIVVDSMDLHFVRQTRKGYLADGRRPALLDPEFGFAYVRELNTYAAADAVWTVSQTEADLVNSVMGLPGLAAAVPDFEDLPPSDVPFELRKGILYIGNFRHDPNRSAVEYLCRCIVPLIDPELLREHPVMIVGNALDPSLRQLGDGLQGVLMIGWTPSVLPYLHGCRISVLPLLYGAGTKRKLVQSLMCGTPAVSTWIGVEGLDLKAGTDVLVADNARDFSHCITRLLTDTDLWHNLAQRGRAHVLKDHSRQIIAAGMRSQIDRLFCSPPKPANLAVAADILRAHWLKPQYQRLLDRIRRAVLEGTPESSLLLVVSKGDEQLLQFPSRRASHFPADDQGNYTGYHPPDSDWCIRRLESAAATGALFVIPAPFLWWLDHYRELKDYLLSRCRLVCDDRETCLIFDLSNGPAANVTETDDKPGWFRAES